MTTHKTPAQKNKYSPPCVRSYGDIRDMTRTSSNKGSVTDNSYNPKYRTA
jgi:hypothetical protein